MFPQSDLKRRLLLVYSREFEAIAQMLNRLQRAQGRAQISFKVRGGDTVLDDLFQSGSAKVRIARREPGRLCEAVLINTSGGMTGGDEMDVAVEWADDTTAIVTTQAAERHYQSIGDTAQILTKLKVGKGGCGFWLPQEAIMFDSARYQRITEVDLSPDAQFLGVESSIFGRAAMGEIIEQGYLREVWQVRVAGKLVFCDAFGLSGDINNQLNHPSVTQGMRAISTIIVKSDNGSGLIADLRDLISSHEQLGGIVGGATTVKPMLIVRLFAKNSQLLRDLGMAILEKAMKDLTQSDLSGSLLPRVWRS